MIAWPDGFCERLAERGFFVIRYDNRDIGRSTHLRDLRPPTIAQLVLRDKRAAPLLARRHGGRRRSACSTALGIERAHVAGASMGGMIAQTIAVRYPGRVLSLASIMSNTGHRWQGHARAAHLPDLPAPPGARPRGARSRRGLRASELIGSPGFDRRRGRAPRARRAQLRARLRPGRQRAPARRDRRRRRPQRRAAPDRRRRPS